MNDSLRLAIMSAVTQAIPALQLLGILPPLTTDEIAIVVACVNQALLLAAFVLKSGQQPAVQPVVRVSIPDREQKFTHPDPKGGTCVSWVPEIWDGSPTRCHCGALELVGEPVATG